MAVAQLASLAGGMASQPAVSGARQNADADSSAVFGNINFDEESLDKNIRNGFIFVGVLAGVFLLYKAKK